jgi:hypothetical protein
LPFLSQLQPRLRTAASPAFRVGHFQVGTGQENGNVPRLPASLSPRALY